MKITVGSERYCLKNNHPYVKAIVALARAYPGDARSTDPIPERNDVKHLWRELGDMPNSDGLIRPEDLDCPEPKYPLDVAFCGDCSLVQILETVPPEDLFETLGAHLCQGSFQAADQAHPTGECILVFLLRFALSGKI